MFLYKFIATRYQTQRRKGMRRTTSLNTHERVTITDVMPTEAVVSAALAPTLEARIQSLEVCVLFMFWGCDY